MTFLFILGIILIRNLFGKTYTNVFSNNCSQTYFDEATLNYMASFTFISENIDGSCPNAKAIAFRKTDLLDVDMELRIVESIWSILNKTQKRLLKDELLKRLHFSCNSVSLRQELCRSSDAHAGAVFISVYDGSLVNHPFQKSCSICLLKTRMSERRDLLDFNDISSTLARVNLSLFDIIDWRELQSEDILSAKLIRSRNDRRQISGQILSSIFGTDFPFRWTPISDSVVYNIQVRLRSGRSHINSRKNQHSGSGCLFRCDWSSKCLASTKSICDNKVDCSYGDDENPLICRLYSRLNHNNKVNSSVSKLFNYTSVVDQRHQYEHYLKFVIPAILSILLLGIVAIKITMTYRCNKRKELANKKMCNISNIDFSKLHNQSIYLQKSSLEALVPVPVDRELVIKCAQEEKILSRWRVAAIHQTSTNNDCTKQFIHPKSFRKPERSDIYCNEQYSDLCEQINYPDTRTRSNWLRAYFQLSRSNNVNQKKPPVLNISQFPPVSFSCKL